MNVVLILKSNINTHDFCHIYDERSKLINNLIKQKDLTLNISSYYKDKKYSGAKKYKDMLQSEGEFTKIPTCLYKAGEIEKGVEKKDTGKKTKRLF